jgi:hypothetical protein
LKFTSVALICSAPALMLVFMWGLGGFTTPALTNGLTNLFWACATNVILWIVTARTCSDEGEPPTKAVFAALLFWALWPACVALNNTRDKSHFVRATVDYSTSRHRTGKQKNSEWEEVYVRATDENQKMYQGQFRANADPKIGSGEKVIFEVHDGLFWGKVTSAKVGNRSPMEL